MQTCDYKVSFIGVLNHVNRRTDRQKHIKADTHTQTDRTFYWAFYTLSFFCCSCCDKRSLELCVKIIHLWNFFKHLKLSVAVRKTDLWNLLLCIDWDVTLIAFIHSNQITHTQLHRLRGHSVVWGLLVCLGHSDCCVGGVKFHVWACDVVSRAAD